VPGASFDAFGQPPFFLHCDGVQGQLTQTSVPPLKSLLKELEPICGEISKLMHIWL
jgi:hypothetical protein